MAGAAHEILVMALKEQPELLTGLLARLHRIPVAAPLSVVDSSVRFADVKEVRPDVLFRAADLPWLVLEVQQKIDERKRRRWPLLAAVLTDEHQAMGELLVLTARRAVARWARRGIVWKGKLGTEMRLSPLVLEVSLEVAESLVDDRRPELSLLAAWALQHKHGPRSRRIAERALRVCDRLPGALRQAQVRAILQVLSPPLVAHLRHLTMDLSKIPESKAFQEFRLALEAKGKAEGMAKGMAKGMAQGKAEAIVAVLEARGMRVTGAVRKRVLGCTEVAQLDAWLRRAAVVDEVRDLFG